MADQHQSLASLEYPENFISRHIGSNYEQQKSMLKALKVDSIEQLIQQTVPEDILIHDPLNLGPAISETDALKEIKAIAQQNKIFKSYIGQGYHPCITPSVIQRNVFENPGWYTAYTPYQAEISQGRLAALLNFQQMITDLTGFEIANASLLDEATAAAEAMSMAFRHTRGKKVSNRYFVAHDVHPQTIDLIKCRAQYQGIEVVVGDPIEITQEPYFGAQLQYPNTYGEILDLSDFIQACHQKKTTICLACDPLALVLLKSPAELGADIAIGSSQRFGVPMGFGGPHAAFFAAKSIFKRSIPGRIIGVSADKHQQTALRLAMQTREQHIRREKATSNICTAQSLLANMAGFYAVYHGAQGLKRIAERVHRLTTILAKGLKALGVNFNSSYFDTLTLTVGSDQQAIYKRALEKGCNLRLIGNNRIGLSINETTTGKDIKQLFDVILGQGNDLRIEDIDQQIVHSGILPEQRRTDPILTHPNFTKYHSETDMLRYLKTLENRDYSLTHGMIPLGSCTMKLNATSQMQPVSWPEFSDIHPFAPDEQTQGYHTLIQQLCNQLVEITGFDQICLQPNSGSQGEYSGLRCIRNYQKSQGQGHRNICLIPSSAHGTNPASAQMAGMQIVVLACDSEGNIDIKDLEEKAKTYHELLSALMITYPSTHGVFEVEIRKICQIIHQHGGQVYLDGANFNAMVGITQPGKFGADVSHLNLHKTFAIPHGGGGPGVGPIGVKNHLAPFLPNHSVKPITGLNKENHAISAAPYGSASILPISWMYIKMLGRQGLKAASEVAILQANYIAQQLAPYYQIVYQGMNQRVAHECIIDIRPIKEQTGISEEDIAKRLMDYGFHGPTMSFPVTGTLMIEPTESEPKAELDRFIQSLIQIKDEINRIKNGEWPADDNPLVNAPHTLFDLTNPWHHPYSQNTAVTPTPWLKVHKQWPTVNRIDNVKGDRQLICSCPPMENYL